jgi:prevent-host-death family protein
MPDRPEVVNIHAAKTHFSRLVARAEAGEEIVIARDGRVVARLVPLKPAEPRASSSAGREGHATRETTAAYDAGAWAPPPSVDLLPAIVGRIVRLVDPARIVLFGSRASGLAQVDSDYDLLVVLDHIDDRRARRIALRAALADLPVGLDIVVAEPAELDATRQGPRGIVQWAAEGGREVYVRA